MTGGTITKAIERVVRVARILPDLARSLPRETVQRRILVPLAARARNALRFALVRQTRIVDIFFGRRAGNVFFWRSPTIPKTWDHVERRLFALDSRDPASVGDFVHRALSASDDFVVLTNLGRSSVTRAAMADLLGSIDLSDGSSMARRIGASHALGAAIVGVGTLLLAPAEAERLAARVKDLLPGLTEGYFALVDSLGARPARSPSSLIQRSLPGSGFLSGCRHRLIIAGGLQDQQSISLLFPGADKVTLYPMNDLYGKADFGGMDLHGPADNVSVEHARSRITRFSADYHRLHAETRAVSERIVARLADADGEARILPPDGRPFAELALADNLFFPALMLAAVRKLLEDQDFDHVVIALSGRKSDADLVPLLAGLQELTRDPRVEIVSVSRALGDRGAFSTPLSRLLGGDRVERPSRYWGPGMAVAAQDFDRACAMTMPNSPAWAGDGRPRVLMVSAPSRAYDTSSAAYRAALGRRYDTQTAFIGKSVVPLLLAGADAALPASGGLFAIPIEINRLSERPFVAMRLWLGAMLSEVAAEFPGTVTGHLLSVRQHQVVRNGLLSFVVFHRRSSWWFARMEAEGTLPAIVVLTPSRDAYVASMTATARAYRVPSLAVEPHGLNATYCRYNMVHADHYGVITTFFRDEAVAGFGIPEERCHVVGSPRLTAVADYDLAQRTAEARAAATRDYGIAFAEGATQLAFFSQPSTWDQISAVWRILIEGSAGTDTTILLKTHPEETPTRVAEYLAIAAELGASGRVKLWPGNAREAMECADLVLSAYSATVVEAATLRRPVICIANGDIDYPLDQHRVIGAPLVRDAAALATALRAFLADPAPMRARAAGFVEREHHLVEGIEAGLSRVVDKILAMPPGKARREAQDLPESAFLKEPHRVFAV